MADEYGVMGDGELVGFERQRSKAREGAVLSAVRLIADVRTGRVPYYLLSEAMQPKTPGIARMIASNYPGIINVRETMTTSDFPLLMASTMERMMLARWQAFPQAWRSFVGVGTRRDFRTGSAIALDGLEGVFPAQPEQTELEYGALSEAAYSYGVKKYSLGAKLSWELMLNDDLNAFNTIPDRLGRGAARTVARYVTGLYADSAGPNATFFSAGNGNLLTSNPVLTTAALGVAYGALRARVDANSEPIMVESAVLVVGPGNEVNARNILGATQILPASAGGGPIIDNWLRTGITLVIDPYLPIVTTTGAVGATEWFLFANPNVARPAIELSFLSGFEQPQMYQKIANTARVGGGIAQEMGDFSTLSSEIKCVTAFGGSLLDYRSAVASKGTG